MNLPEPIGEAALAFFQKLLGPVGEAGEFLTDKVRFYRWKSSLKTMEKAKKIALERGLNINEVPLKFLVPFMEKSSLEEEDSPLIDRWAQLLAQAADDSHKAKISFVDILSRLTSREIILLEDIITIREIDKIRITHSEILELPALSQIYCTLAASERLRGIEIECNNIWTNNNGSQPATFDETRKFLFNDALRKEIARTEYARHRFFAAAPDRFLEILSSNESFYKNASSVDILISCGLLQRSVFQIEVRGGRLTVSLIYPTPLAIEFVGTCRGDDLSIIHEEG